MNRTPLSGGGAEDECPLPCGRLITASGMGLLPDLPKTALSPQQKWPLDLPKNAPESDVARCRRLVLVVGPAPVQPMICRGNAAGGDREALIRGNLGPAHIALPHEYITGTPSTPAGHWAAR